MLRVIQKLMASQQGTKALMQDLERANMERATEVPTTFKEKTQKERDAVQESLQHKRR